MVVLAAFVREPLLQVGGPACLHDTGRDGRLPQPEGGVTPPLHLHIWTDKSYKLLRTGQLNLLLVVPIVVVLTE